MSRFQKFDTKCSIEYVANQKEQFRLSILRYLAITLDRGFGHLQTPDLLEKVEIFGIRYSVSVSAAYLF